MDHHVAAFQRCADVIVIADVARWVSTGRIEVAGPLAALTMNLWIEVVEHAMNDETNSINVRRQPETIELLITGRGRLIGSHVADALLAAGHQVRVLDNLDPQVHGQGGQWPATSIGVETQRGDVRNHDDVRAALEGCDVVIHLAAAVGVGQSMYEIERLLLVSVIARRAA